MKKYIASIVITLALAACGQTTTSAPAELPKAQVITEHSKGYYCTMNLAEHNGPKAQIFLDSKPNEPLWFSTVTQIFGFVQHPGEPKDIAAIYVSDMGAVADWNTPNSDVWIDAKTAYYVIDSQFVGGMGTADALPFADASKAQAYAQQHGGKVVTFDTMPESYIYK